jgi:asparagine synthetase B (glutamine-hydrolysing)
MIWFESSVDFFYFGTFPLSEKSHRLSHNSHYAYYLNLRILFHKNNELHQWDLTQYKNDYEDWENAFIEAVEKRYHKNLVLALSGGIDSSCIAAALSDLKLDFYSVTLNINRKEDSKSLLSILRYTKKYNKYKILKTKDVINYYSIDTINFESLLYNKQLIEYGLTSLCLYMHTINKNVLCTGQGADEIVDNYIHKYKVLGKPKVSMLYWSEDLKSFFPYDHFYENRQRKLIDDHESCCLSYGIESRNPFLDKKLTQEWLSLSTSLKNCESKSPLKHFLTKRNILISEKVLGFGDQKVFIDK